MDDASFRGDCGRCAALCCVLLGFDRGPHFAFDKPAGTACGRLGSDHRCTIHARLGASGMGGCAAYDCRGAGQSVTAMFAGLDPVGDPAVVRAMATAFALMREVQLIRLLLARTPGNAAAAALAADLEREGGWTYSSLLALDLGAIRSRLREVLRVAA